MKLRKTLLCGVAATALGLAAALPNSSILPNLTTPAQAQVQASVSIGFGTFYDSLSPHGDWVRLEGRYVWVPGDVRADWRPYTVGRWAYTRPYGWTWVSDEPYGWAVYHYGRWGFQPAIGWYWVPDTVWAPAWVTWRGSGDYTAWAPMPPQGVVGISYEVNPVIIPARYWVAVPTNRFLAPNIFSVALHFGEPEFYDVVRYTRPIGHVRIVNNIAINTVINVNYIEEVTGESVEVRQVNFASDPQEVQVTDDAVALYAPTVEEEPEAEPQQVRTVEEVSQRRGADVAAEQADEEADRPVEVADDAPPLPEQAVADEVAPVTDEDVAEEAPPEGTPGAAAVERTPAGQDEEPEAEVTEEATPPEGTPGAAAVEETPAGEGEEPEAEVTEEAPPEGTPGAAAVEQTPADEPQVEERAIGEPESQGRAQGQEQGQTQGKGQEQRKERRDDEEEVQ